MEKRTIITIAIIITIISLLFSILSYNGIFRYLYCYVRSVDNLIGKYKELHKSHKEKVIIAFTSSTDTVSKLKPFVNSILDQTEKVNQITFIKKNIKYHIPNYMKDIAVIIPSGRDYGEGMTIIPMLLKENDRDTIIIALTENVIYGYDFISTMLEESKNHPNYVIVDNKGYAILFKPDHFNTSVIDQDKKNIDKYWIISKAKQSKTIYYSENYRIIGF